MVLAREVHIPGSIETTRSGQFRAYYMRDRQRHTPGHTFAKRKDAEDWLLKEKDLVDTGKWTPPAKRREDEKKAARAEIRDQTTLGEIARAWIENRTTKRGTPLAPRTIAEYHTYLNGRLSDLAGTPIVAIDRKAVDAWWLQNQSVPLLRHHAYAFLKSVMADAVDREVIASNPCKIRNAASRTTGRPKAVRDDLITGLTPLDVATLAEATKPDRWRVLVLLLAYSGLRPNEAFALTRSDVVQGADEDGTPRWTVKVTKALSKTVDGTLGAQPPKTPESIRFVPLPPHVANSLASHIDRWAAPSPDGLLFPSTNPANSWPTIQQVMGTSAKQRTGKGRTSKPRTPTGFNAARISIGRPALRLYDLRRWARHMWRKAGLGDADCEQLLGHVLDPVMGAYVTLDREGLWPYMERLSELAGWTKPIPTGNLPGAPAIDPRLLAAMTPEQLNATLAGMTEAQLAEIVPLLSPEMIARALTSGSTPIETSTETRR